ncbi:MAG: N-acetylmuramoyl-L-alanine amidase [Candidatus Omnitrophica bacterium]|nr:N-acetylmuramoyl-L-alanine amidase [Candidatus Omnitrophota bacterium]
MNKKLLLLLVIILFISGCATAPVREALPVYSLNGTAYYSLSALCQSRGVSLKYDIYTRTANLIKDNHVIDLMVGDNLVLVDKRALLLKYPVDMHQGMIVVPAQFKELALDPLFKVARAPAKPREMPLGLFIKKVVIDPGHGGKDPGAIGRTGLKEKDVNLDIAKRLANRFRQEGVEVIMTRNSDVFIPLGKRVEIANNSRADLFISIHANANKTRSLHGFEVYYVSPTVNDSTRAAYAAKHFYLNLDSSYFASNSQTLKAILWDMIYTYNRAKSISLGRDICRAAGDNLNVRIIGVKDARFEVLRGTRMPAVLIEVGFLSNAREEQLLRDGHYRDKLAQSILEGVFDYAKKLQLLTFA